MIQPSTRTCLDLFPDELLQNIVSRVDALGITKLLPDKQFLLSNKNLKNAIDYELQKTGTYRFDNRVTQMDMSNLTIWKTSQYDKEIDHWRDESISDFTTLQEFKIFDDYCVEERLNVTSKISYTIKTILDYFEFEELIAGLKVGKETRLALRLTFEYKKQIDGTALPDKLIRLKDRLVELSLDGWDHFEFEINVGTLENIETLKISQHYITGSLLNCRKLRELLIDGNDELDITNLPALLETFHMQGCIVEFPSAENGAVTFPRPKNFSFKDQNASSIENVLRCMISSKVESITFNSVDHTDRNDWFSELLSDLQNDHNFNLHILSLTGLFFDPLSVFPSHRITFYNNQDFSREENSPSISTVPHTLTELTLYQISLDMNGFLFTKPLNLKKCSFERCFFDLDQGGLDFSGFGLLTHLLLIDIFIGDKIINASFPDALMVLELRRLEIKSLAGVSFPLSLIELDISNNEIEFIDNVLFPASIRDLNLTANNIRSLKGVKFPPMLTRLGASGNQQGDISGDDLPLTLKELQVSKVRHCDLTKNISGNTLQIEKLCLAFRFSGESFLLPGSIKSLDLRNLGRSFCHKFDSNLTRLAIKNADLSLGNVTFEADSQLRYLCLKSCEIGKINYPPLLIELDLSYNHLAEIPSEVGQIKHLRILQLHHNKVKSAKVSFSHNSLEIFDLSHNQVQEVQLSFPQGLTNLKQLNLSVNRLTEISMDAIGQKKGTIHDSLYELLLLKNKKLTREHIVSLASHVSESAKYLLVSPPFSKSFMDPYNYLIEYRRRRQRRKRGIPRD